MLHVGSRSDCLTLRMAGANSFCFLPFVELWPQKKIAASRVDREKTINVGRFLVPRSKKFVRYDQKPKSGRGTCHGRCFRRSGFCGFWPFDNLKIRNLNSCNLHAGIFLTMSRVTLRCIPAVKSLNFQFQTLQ